MFARAISPAAGIAAYLDAQAHSSLLRFITCGSVDDGKSTLIGRLLYESKMIFEDQLATLRADSRRRGARPGELDLALLVDGLAAEREQGITIDVAYRFFSTARRKFIVADTPGHEQYTRNMATGASTADLAILLVDARKGLLTQTRRHSLIVSLLGIRHVVLAVNKMDAVGHSQEAFDRIVADYRGFAAALGFAEIVAIPLSALHGDNVVAPSRATPWYRGPTLLQHLDAVEIGGAAVDRPFRLPVQWVNRPDQDFRGYAGLVAGGALRPGDVVRVLPSGQQSRIRRIVSQDGDLDLAMAGQSITVTLHDAIDVSRGDILAAADRSPAVADQFQTTVIWMHEAPLLAGRPYLMKLGAQTVTATVTHIRHRIDVDTQAQIAAKQLGLNEIGVATLSTDRRIAFDAYADSRETGGFILIDKLTNDTVGAGMIGFALRRSDNIHWHQLDVDKRARARAMGQRACVLWFTGLSGAGKSTIANLVDKRLHQLGRHTVLLDGDNVRHGLNRDLGFTDADRVENIRRVAEVAKLMVEAGLIVLVSFISPFRAERDMARARFEEGEFYEIFVETALATAEARDVKGLYQKARAGTLKNFTGIDSPYERPERPDIRLDTESLSPEEAADLVVDRLRDAGRLEIG